MRANLLGDGQRLLIGDGLHLPLAKGLCSRAIISQIELGADKNDGDIRGVVLDLGVPLHRQKGQKGLSTKVWAVALCEKGVITLALTLSNDGGLTMEKQMRKTSVWG